MDISSISSCRRTITGAKTNGAEVQKIMHEEESHLPRGTTFALRGQIETMQSSFFRLGLGMVFADGWGRAFRSGHKLRE